VFFVFGILLVATLFFMPVFPSFVLIDWFDERGTLLPWLHTQHASGPAGALLRAGLPGQRGADRADHAGLGRHPLGLPAAPAAGPLGKVHSNTYCKKWLVSHIQESSLNVLHGIYATVFAPFWYRLLGAKVGRDAEISTALGVVPDMLTLGDETFIADAVMLGDEQIDGGWMTMQRPWSRTAASSATAATSRTAPCCRSACWSACTRTRRPTSA
jgi:hypothetical protein